MGPGEPVSEGPLAAGVSAAPAGMGRAGGGGRTRKLATAASGDVSCVLVEASRARDVTDGCRSNGASRRLGVRRSDFNAGDDGELGSVRAGFFFSEDGTLPTKRPVLDDETSGHGSDSGGRSDSISWPVVKLSFVLRRIDPITGVARLHLSRPPKSGTCIDRGRLRPYVNLAPDIDGDCAFGSVIAVNFC
jgi:hypothetical protein